MKRITFTLAVCTLVAAPALAQYRGVSRGASPYVGGGGSYAGGGSSYAGNTTGSSYAGNLGTQFVNPYSGYGNPYAGGYNPYLNPYGNPYSYNGVPFTTFGSPYAVGNGFYGMNANGRNFNFWKAPSGYYYPWTAGYGSGYTAPIVIINQGSNSPTAARPPLSTMFTDTLKYLDEQKAAGKLSQGDYEHLKRRTLDLLSKERDLRTQGGGGLDTDQENSIRADVDTLGGEIARRVQI